VRIDEGNIVNISDTSATVDAQLLQPGKITKINRNQKKNSNTAKLKLLIIADL